MLVGDTGDLPPGLVALSTTGLLRHESQATIQQWIDAAVAAGLIAISNDQYRTLSLTATGRAVMSGRAQNLQMSSPVRLRHLPSLRSFRRGRRLAHRRRSFFDER
jgi:hypothetical protein